MTDFELSLLVAEKIMGYGSKTRACRQRRSGMGCGCCEAVPHYATNMERAWEVVEHVLHEKPETGLVKVWRGFEGAEPYGPSGYVVWLGDSRSWATTAARAFCLAALNVYGMVVR